MSIALWGHGGLRFWNEQELDYREWATKHLNSLIRNTLTNVNRAWSFHRVESPMLVPGFTISPSYDSNDIWAVEAEIMGSNAALRPETTAGSYQAAEALLRDYRMPIAVWQVGKSYRRETNDGASASKLRFNEFTQAEWQCIYAASTKADYRAAIENMLKESLRWLCNAEESRIVDSDRLPSYSTLTRDVEVRRADGRWVEVCSISTRTDFLDKEALVLEIAVGMDRVVEIAHEEKE